MADQTQGGHGKQYEGSCHCGRIAPCSEAGDPRSGTLMAAVNVRCLARVDLESLSITTYDGAAL